MSRRMLFRCDFCEREADTEKEAHIEAFVIGGGSYDEPRTDMCIECWTLAKVLVEDTLERNTQVEK